MLGVGVVAGDRGERVPSERRLLCEAAVESLGVGEYVVLHQLVLFVAAACDEYGFAVWIVLWASGASAHLLVLEDGDGVHAVAGDEALVVGYDDGSGWEVDAGCECGSGCEYLECARLEGALHDAPVLGVEPGVVERRALGDGEGEGVREARLLSVDLDV